MTDTSQPNYPVSGDGRPAIRSSFGVPADHYHSSLSAGPNGPLLLGDIHLLDKLAHFDRERIPERVVHAKGAGAHGYFEVTHDISHYSKAKFLDRVGKRTPVFARFSTVGYEKGSADSFRDPRGFAVKFYTEDGNWDMVGNNTPVFFIRDGMKFPDFIHTQKKNPGSNLPDPDAFWDFLSLEPESIHQVMILFSDRGTPNGYRHMNGYGSHSYKMVNKNGEVFYVKFHFKTNQGIKNFTAEEASKLGGVDPDYATRDLYNSIARGESPSWNLYLQIMPFENAKSYRWNVLDVTKVWPHKDYPLIPVGTLVLNRNPENYFAETEQSAFSPAHLVPGIEPSEDKMLQSRLFSYTDTHRHRLGPNYHQIPINSPWNATTKKGDYSLRDGPMSVDGNKGSMPNYAPNSHQNFPANQPQDAMSQYNVDGLVGRYPIKVSDDDFVQPRELYQKVMNETDRDHLISNIAGHLSNAKKEIQERQCQIISRVDPEFGKRVAHAIGLRPLSLKANF